MNKHGKVPFIKNKHWEMQISLGDIKHFFEIHLALSTKTDHAGMELYIKLFPLFFEFNVYDSRHWCEQCNKFKEESCYKEAHDGMNIEDYKDDVFPQI